VNRGTHIRAALLAAALGIALVLPAGADAATSVSLNIPKGKARAALTDKVVVGGLLANPAPGEQVAVKVSASGRELFRREIAPKPNGTFEVPVAVNACCRYEIEAKSTGGQSAAVSFTTSVPKKLRKGKIAKLFNRSLQDQGFHTGTRGPRVTSGTHLAIKAFRKVNGMRWSERYSPAIFRTLLQGQGAFKPRFDDGKHVEVDISKQVMSLVEGDTPKHTFHISSGTGGTPTVLGNYRFYLKQPGYNGSRMYYSVYFIGGYATHGYSSVPNGRASHGCVRNPIQFSRFIYNWIDLGDSMHTYV
jgi:L,D-transpeptidase catalytic domain